MSRRKRSGAERRRERRSAEREARDARAYDPVPEHRQEYVALGDRAAEVDAGIAELILACWRADLTTLSSCENLPGTDGRAFVSFPTEEEARRFASLAGLPSALVKAEGVGEEYAPGYFAEEGEGVLFGVAFPAGDVAEVAAAIRAQLGVVTVENEADPDADDAPPLAWTTRDELRGSNGAARVIASAILDADPEAVGVEVYPRVTIIYGNGQAIRYGNGQEILDALDRYRRTGELPESGGYALEAP